MERQDPAAMFALFDATSGAIQAIADAVPAEAWGNAAPCDDWTARDVINHLIQSNAWTISLLTDGTTPRPKGDITGEDPAAALRASFAEARAALRGRDESRTVTSPFGEMPPSGFAGFLATHIMNHGWELAKATGQSTDIAPEIAETLLVMTKASVPGGPRVGAPFDPETIVPESASAADRLAAYLGHKPEHFDHLGPGAAATTAEVPDIATLLAGARDEVGSIIGRVTADQWSLMSPCTEWTVRDVVNHLIGGNEVVAQAFSGPTTWVEGDLAGDDPLGTFTASCDRVIAAATAPQAMEQVLHLPYGDFPAPMAVGFRFIDIMNHGWDIARATGQSTAFAPELNRIALEQSRGMMAHIDRSANPVFGQEQPAPEGGSVADAFAAFMGRVIA